MRHPTATPERARLLQGFTLIEVLVAIAVMAMMAVMSWRGLDAMLRTQSALAQRADQIRTLQSGLAQWQTDLNRLSTVNGVTAWDWDGRVLRLTREDVQAEQGLRVVAWTWRQDANRLGSGDWMRWQSPALQTRADWRQAWANAQQWSQTPTAELRTAEVNIHPLNGWQLFVHRGGSWTNPLSSDATSASAGTTAGATNTGVSTPATPTVTTPARLPDGVRLLLDLPAQGPLGGRITLDWVRPTLIGAPS